MSGRNSNGTFALGNPGGPGRPRRAVEREYLAALSDAVDLDTWREICKAAADKAKAGDGKAREWLTRLLLGSEPPRLSAITIKELAEISAEAELASKAKRERMIFDVS